MSKLDIIKYEQLVNVLRDVYNEEINLSNIANTIFNAVNESIEDEDDLVSIQKHLSILFLRAVRDFNL